MNKTILAVSLSLLTIMPAFVYAGPIIRSGDAVSVDSAQVLKGDFYGLASKVTISGPAEDDAYIAGGTVTVTAPVAKDLTILGGVVQIHGDVGDDLRVVGGEVTLGDVTIKGDVAVLGGVLTILSGATIEGDILFMGGDLVVEGDVAGTIHGTSETIRVNGKVGGDIQYTNTGTFTVGDKAHVLGNIQYKSYNDMTRAQDAQVVGEIQKIKVTPQSNKDLLQLYFFFVSMLLFSALGFFLIAKRSVVTLVTTTKHSLAIAGLVGLGVFLALPFISALLVVSAVGILAGIMLLVTYIFLLLVALALSGIMVGYHGQMLLMKDTTVSFMTVCCGVLFFSLLSFIPYIGGFIMFACVVVTLGLISLKIYYKLRR